MVIVECNGAEVVAIREALKLFRSRFQGQVIIKSDSRNALYCMSGKIRGPWRLERMLKEFGIYTIS